MHHLLALVISSHSQTFLCAYENSSLQELMDSGKHDAISPIKGPEQPFRSPIIRDPDLGILTTWASAIGDRTIIFRSWGLMEGGKYYGEDFTWNEYMRVRNYFSAVFFFIVFNLAMILPLFGPFR